MNQPLNHKIIQSPPSFLHSASLGWKWAAAVLTKTLTGKMEYEDQISHTSRSHPLHSMDKNSASIRPLP